MPPTTVNSEVDGPDCFPKQQFLYFFPPPQGQGSLRPIFISYSSRA